VDARASGIKTAIFCRASVRARCWAASKVYGQHEISELTRYPEKLADLLRRFTEPASDTTAAKTQLQVDLERSRGAIVSQIAEIGRIEEALAALPTLKEHLKRFAAAGLDAKLKDKTLIDEEGRFFEQAEELAHGIEELADQVLAEGTPESPLVGDEAKNLPCHSACNFDPLSRGIGVQN
jgi:hypothetical protein